MMNIVGNRAEADRWLATAEKLLATRDLHGARTFAIRARESDVTRTEFADRILAVSETLLAGETPVSNTHHYDWYAILRIGRFTHNHDLVASQYRMLALLLNPAKNRLPFSDQAFKLVSDAWFVLSNPTKKALYDHELQLSLLGQLGQLGQFGLQFEPQAQHLQQPQQVPPPYQPQHREQPQPQPQPQYREQPHSQFREQPQSQYREQPQSQFREQPHSQYREQPQSQYREQPQSQFREQPQSQFKEQPQSQYREQPQSQFREQPHSQFREQPQSQFREQPQSQYREQPQSQYREQPQSQYREQPLPHPHHREQPQPLPLSHPQHREQPQPQHREQPQPQHREQPQPQPQHGEQPQPQPQHGEQPQPQSQHGEQPQPQPENREQPQPEHREPPQQREQPPPPPQMQASRQSSPQPVRTSPPRNDGKEIFEEERPNLNNATESVPQTQSDEPIWKTPSTEPSWKSPETEPTWKSGSTGVSEPSQEQSSESGAESFWTACPYCYMLFEYQKIYAECTLRCQNCRKPFHAIMIPSPPLTGKTTYFCCWGYFPLGVSNSGKDKGSWSPFSSMFACPIQNVSQDQNKKAVKKKQSAPRVYYDDDVYINLSDPSDDDDYDEDWEKETRKKKAKFAKGKVSMAKQSKKSHVERVKKGKPTVSGHVQVGSGGGGGSGNGEDTNGCSVVRQSSAVGTSSGASKVVGSSGRKQMGIGAKDLGKLDLNVEFSNEVEEPAAASRMSGGNGGGNGEEDNMEGIGFFEGLDEFLSSLPILSVVSNDKVKAT